MENTSAEKRTTSKEGMLSGAAWSTFTSMATRLLGAIYIIPWYAWMGSHGQVANSLYSMGYNVYALFLLISTIGLPAAIARQVAHYNTTGEEAMAYRLIRQMIIFMFCLGVVAALIMFFGAPLFAEASGKGITGLTAVMRSLAWAVLLFPAMSIIRGYFMGLNDQKTLAMSQIAEQVIRVIWMLLVTFMIMRLGFDGGNYVNAVIESTLAAAVGMIASIIVLVWFLLKTHNLEKIIRPVRIERKVKASALILQTLYQAIPFVIIGSAIQIFQLIDQVTFIHVMTGLTHESSNTLLNLFADFSANTSKLTMILISVAASFGDVALSMITTTFQKGDRKQTRKLIAYDFQLFAAIMLPAVAGMMLLAIPLYTLFYAEPTSLQLGLFSWSLLQSLILGLYMMIFPIIMSLGYMRSEMKFFVFGLFAKIIFQVPSILIFQAYGPLFATTIGFLIFTGLTLRKIHRVTGFRARSLVKNIIGLLILTMIMLVGTLIIYSLLEFFLRGMHMGKVKALIEILVAGSIGAYLYLFLAAKIGFLEKLMGARGTSLRRKLKL